MYLELLKDIYCQDFISMSHFCIVTDNRFWGLILFG